jgi:transcriptional regulator with PAS, ATPase and Fis domain
MENKDCCCKNPTQGNLLSNLQGCIIKQLMGVVDVGYLVCTSDGTILYLNKAYSEMFQMDLKEAVGSNICQYFPNSRLMAVMRSGKADEGIIFPFKGRDAYISRHPVFDEGVVIGGYIEVFCRDITQLSDLAHRVQRLESKVRLCRGGASSLPRAHYTFSDIISQCPVVDEVKARAYKFAQTDLPVLIYGETGTGKELFAHSIHAASPRSHGPFITVNCAAIPENLLESELFGYEEGTFTGARQGGQAGKFELADGGSIFLDEIGTLSLTLQAKLLRIIESKEIQKLGSSKFLSSDFRLIAATNLDLWKSVDKGLFRQDLLYRLCSLLLSIPPLRERKGDIPLLVNHQLSIMGESKAHGKVHIHPDIMAILEHHPWPGNIRELRNLISAAAISLDDHTEDTIQAQHLPLNGLGVFEIIGKMSGPRSSDSAKNLSLKQARSASEWEIILAAVREAGGNKSRAANMLGISRNELYRKLRKRLSL